MVTINIQLMLKDYVQDSSWAPASRPQGPLDDMGNVRKAMACEDRPEKKTPLENAQASTHSEDLGPISAAAVNGAGDGQTVKNWQCEVRVHGPLDVPC